MEEPSLDKSAGVTVSFVGQVTQVRTNQRVERYFLSGGDPSSDKSSGVTARFVQR